MGNHDYISMNNGIVSINCVDVPNKGFLDATLTKDIAKIKFLSAQDKKSMQDYTPGGPDVIVRHITGEIDYITRKELKKRYVHASGNKINVAILKNNKWYIVYAPCNIQYKIMKLPNNCSAMLPDGSPAKRGSYIICRQDGNGQIIRETMKDIHPSAFKKMFKVPMQPVIRRAVAGGKSGKEFTLFRANNRTNMNKIRSIKPHFDSSELDMNPNNINISAVSEQTNMPNIGAFGTNRNTQNNMTTFKPSFDRIKTTNNSGTNATTINKYKYTVTSRLTDMDGKLVGYVLMEISTQRKKNVKPNDLARFCAAKTVDNVMLVTREDGVQFLKGNGIRLENLPAVLL